MAVVFVSVLEVIVQAIEFCLWKICVFVLLVIFKLCLIFDFIRVKLYYSLRECCWQLCSGWQYDMPQRDEEWLQTQWENIVFWKRLWLPWDGLFAGKNQTFRVLAVILTLVLVVLFVSGLANALQREISDFANGGRLVLYNEALTNVTHDTTNFLNALPEKMTFLDNKTQALMLRKTKELETALHDERATLARLVSAQDALNRAQGLVAYSGEFVTELIFFLLYTFLLLFDPLQINTRHNLTQQANKIYSVRGSLTFYQQPFLSETTREFNAHERFYDDATNPSVGIQRKLNEIIQTYFKVTIGINSAFAVIYGVTLAVLGVDLSVLLAVLGFFLAFIPELGVIITVLIPLPFILLNPSPPHGMDHLHVLFWYCVSNALNKLILVNGLGATLLSKNPILNGYVDDKPVGWVEWLLDCIPKRMKRTRSANAFVHTSGRHGSSNEDRLMGETHPVLVLLAVVLAGDIWGTAGMFIAVPLISVVRLAIHFWYRTENIRLEDALP